MLLEGLLSRQGARVTCVDSGGAAVERVRRDGADAFDILLTDIQMPDMDGYQTTARIHELAPALPVIGLTGNTEPEERALCLAAGMADHVPKPFDLEVLVAAIRHHARRLPQEPAAAVDWSGLMARYGNRESFVARLMATIRSSNAGTPAKLRAAVDLHDMMQLAVLAHTLKGTAGNLMASPLRELAARTERAAHVQAPDALTLGRQLATALEQTLSALEHWSLADSGGAR